MQKLIAAGVHTVESLADMTPEQLEAIPGIGPEDGGEDLRGGQQLLLRSWRQALGGARGRSRCGRGSPGRVSFGAAARLSYPGGGGRRRSCFRGRCSGSRVATARIGSENATTMAEALRRRSEQESRRERSAARAKVPCAATPQVGENSGALKDNETADEDSNQRSGSRAGSEKQTDSRRPASRWA